MVEEAHQRAALNRVDAYMLVASRSGLQMHPIAVDGGTVPTRRPKQLQMPVYWPITSPAGIGAVAITPAKASPSTASEQQLRAFLEGVATFPSNDAVALTTEARFVRVQARIGTAAGWVCAPTTGAVPHPKLTDGNFHFRGLYYSFNFFTSAGQTSGVHTSAETARSSTSTTLLPFSPDAGIIDPTHVDGACREDDRRPAISRKASESYPSDSKASSNHLGTSPTGVRGGLVGSDGSGCLHGPGVRGANGALGRLRR
ncbi:unnamed protein product [Phytophthora fragariaefolia]|uniref:Unnamed protein product n=1 Tax=Phytophthora fragariaefolia TaxID=1490495 RepID=A0A9W6XFE1_9STRA|nr:unnamed protein product [Phytophthora fragariaefolia]